ncbi:hypothetical protein BDR26DRAFT_620847 [Obelidium mucronatum]|nr:hypothetical protein BDR26DRAFT_620847 [Obelidium mucronatum]
MQHVGAQTQGIPVTIHHHIPPVAYNQTPPVLASSAVLISVPRIVIESPPLTLAEQALTYSPLEQRGFFSAPPSPSSRPASPMIPISQSRPSSPMIPLSMNDDDQQQQPLPSLASVVPPTLRPHLDSQSRTKQWLTQQNYNVSQPPQFQQLQTQLSPHSLQPLIRSPYESSSSGTTPNDQYLQPAQLSYKRSSSVSSAVSSKGSVSFLVD